MRTSTINNYLSLVKFSHTIFAMPFAIIGFTLATIRAGVGVSLQNLLYVLLCMVFARSAAMAFNRYLDRDIDLSNPRTANREIPAGIIKASNALFFVILNCILFCIVCYLINPLCLSLAPVALAVVLGYSFTKRYTALCHLVLGLGLSLAPIGAYLAVTGHFSVLPILFSFIVLFWVGGFDIIYALQDEEFDKSKNLHSIPTWLGRKGALNFSRLMHVLSAIFVVFAGFYGQFGKLYVIGALFFVFFLIYQHKLVKPNDLSRVNFAFFTLNGIASVIFGVFVVADIIWKL